MKLRDIIKSSLNEMALKHLKGTQQYWDDADYELVANKYIKNALEDGKNHTQILRGLNTTFSSKRFEDKKGQAEEVKKLIRKKIKEMQGKKPDKPKSLLLKKKKWDIKEETEIFTEKEMEKIGAIADSYWIPHGDMFSDKQIKKMKEDAIKELNIDVKKVKAYGGWKKLFIDAVEYA